jgi:hypothetical protein
VSDGATASADCSTNISRSREAFPAPTGQCRPGVGQEQHGIRIREGIVEEDHLG